jgi:hypothetical protein
MSFNGQRQTFLGSHFETEFDRVPDVVQGVFPSCSLTDAARDGGALNDPNTIFIAIKGHLKFHVV